MERFKKFWSLFITFFKISAFTFGGGYAMIPLIQNEISERKKWLNSEEIFSIVIISESTPGPLSINAATYIGYRVAGFWGAFFATLGLIIPPFTIITIISYFFHDFMQFTFIQNMFKGIQAAVSILILDAALKLSKKIEKGWFAFVLIGITFILQILIDAFAWNFSSIYFILAGIFLGLFYYSLLNNVKGRKK